MFVTDEKIVTISGGHGARSLLIPLKKKCSDLTAIVAVTDDGKSSKAWRDLLDIIAVGDVRNVVTALTSENEPDIRAVMEYRFDTPNSWIHDHPIGNVVLAGIIEWGKSQKPPRTLTQSIQLYMHIARAGHRVLPMTNDNAHLVAHMSDGEVLKGEGAIDTRLKKKGRSKEERKRYRKEISRRIVDVSLEPQARLSPEAYEAIVTADKIIFCAGSFWTSLMPNLSVCGFREAIRKSKAKLIYVMNLMTNRNETPRWLASEHARLIRNRIGPTLDVIFCNNGDISDKALARYYKEESELVDIDIDFLNAFAHRVISQNFVSETKYGLRHNERLAEEIINLKD